VTPETVKIVECPRDAWQAMALQIPADLKAEYLNALITAGFKHIDAVSFVSPSAVPQMADSEQVLALLKPAAEVEIIGIVVNERGAARAIRTGSVRTLGFPYSISATFLERNQRQSPEQARQTLDGIIAQAVHSGLGVVVYVSMAFGNPYGEPWSPEDVIAACRNLQAMGVADISLADTVGVAKPPQILSLLRSALAEMPGIRIGAHLHARVEDTQLQVAAAYQAGCRRLDMALGGQGGCPFAQDALVGNVATEAAIARLKALGADLAPLGPLDELLRMGRDIAERFGAEPIGTASAEHRRPT
jgi:hydroxymethylglutaryl-CoA lyase